MASKEVDDPIKITEQPDANKPADTTSPVAFKQNKVEAATQVGERENTHCIEAVIIKKEIVTETNLPDGVEYIWKPRIIRVDRATLRANPEYTDKNRWPHCECCCPNCCTYRSDHN